MCSAFIVVIIIIIIIIIREHGVAQLVEAPCYKKFFIDILLLAALHPQDNPQ